MAYKHKDDQAASARRHYERNKPLMKSRAVVAKKRAVANNVAMVTEYLTAHPCIDCGISDVRVLEFDHRDRSEKVREISDMARRGVSAETLRREIDKCDVRCANCHRIKTKGEGQWGQRPLPGRKQKQMF